MIVWSKEAIGARVDQFARDFEGEPQLTEPDKLSSFGWFTRSDLPQPLSAFAQAAIAHLDADQFA